MNYREKLIPVLADIIDVYVTPWGVYEIDKLTFLQQSYLKESLKNIIKEKIKNFDEKITINDIFIYNSEFRNGSWKILENSSKRGSLNLVKYYHCSIKIYCDYNRAVAIAASEGYLDIIKFLSEEKQIDFDRALSNACRKGHLNIVKYLIEEKGANNFNYSIGEAIFGNHLDIVKYILVKRNNYQEAMFSAKHYGRTEIINYLETLK